MNAIAVGIDQREQRIRRGHRLRRARLDALGEELEPALPVAVQPHFVQQLVVERAMLLEVETGVEHGLAQHAVGHSWGRND